MEDVTDSFEVKEDTEDYKSMYEEKASEYDSLMEKYKSRFLDVKEDDKKDDKKEEEELKEEEVIDVKEI